MIATLFIVPPSKNPTDCPSGERKTPRARTNTGQHLGLELIQRTNQQLVIAAINNARTVGCNGEVAVAALTASIRSGPDVVIVVTTIGGGGGRKANHVSMTARPATTSAPAVSAAMRGHRGPGDGRAQRRLAAGRRSGLMIEHEQCRRDIGDPARGDP